jgi:hypothetical protein
MRKPVRRILVTFGAALVLVGNILVGNVHADVSSDGHIVSPASPVALTGHPRITAALPMPDGGSAVMAVTPDKRGVIFRLDKNGKELWHQAWPDGSPVLGSSRIVLQADGKLLLADGNGSFANIAGDGGALMSISVGSVWAEPLRFFSDGGVVVACGYFDPMEKAIPCIDRLRQDGSRLWLWQDRDLSGDAFIHAIAPRFNGGAVVLVGSVSYARADLFPGRVTARDRQSLICLDQTGSKVGSILLDGFMLPIDMAQTPGGTVFVVGWTAGQGSLLRVLTLAKEGCAITVDRITDLRTMSGRPPTWGRLLIPDDGNVYLALSVKVESGELEKRDSGRTFLASIAADGALQPLRQGGVQGILPSISADGKDLLLVEQGEVRTYSLDSIGGGP